jgi:Domain of unknown function (DUF4136)
MKYWLASCMAASSLLLTGCASTIKSDVTVFHEWPVDLPSKAFVFDHSREQENNPEYRNYENMVRDELKRIGFFEADHVSAATLKVSIQYALRSDIKMTQTAASVDPFWQEAPLFGPGWHGYRFYGPFYDPFWYGPPVTQYRDTQFPLFKRQLRVTISRASNSRRICDVTVNSEGHNSSLAAVMPYLAQSAFADFPGKSGVPRHITLKMQD